MQQLVIRDGLVVATHPMEVFLGTRYPGCEVITWDKSFSLRDENGMPSKDPRTPKEKRDSYADKRRMAYPTIEEQLDMMYHGTWRDAITEVKERFPKSSET